MTAERPKQSIEKNLIAITKWSSPDLKRRYFIEGPIQTGETGQRCFQVKASTGAAVRSTAYPTLAEALDKMVRWLDREPSF